MVSRDAIKDGLSETYRHTGAAGAESELTARTFDIFFRSIELFVSGGATLVAEAAFQDKRWRHGLNRVITPAALKIVHCEVDAEVARERVYQRRLEEFHTRPYAPGRPESADQVPRPSVRLFEPLSLPVPALSVDTTSRRYAPPFEEIVAFALA